MNANDWAAIELRHLLALRAVAQHESFSRAAEELGYTQSAISQQIAVLERIVGQPLFQRPGGPRRIALSEAGELLLRHAGVVIDRLQSARADVEAFAEGAKGTLRVGTYQSVGTRILPAILGEFTAKWPKVGIDLWDSADDDDLLRLLQSGELDFAFVMDSAHANGSFRTTELLQDPYVLLLPASSPLARRRSVRLRELEGQRFVGYRTIACQLHVETWLRRHRAEQEVVLRSSDNATVQQFVATGLGIAIVPLLTVDQNDPNVVIREIQPKIPPRTIVIASHRDRYMSPAAEAFLETARRVGAKIAGRGWHDPSLGPVLQGSSG
ncbi:MAG TPA: LysR family transcriptional regulator [Actinomycetes bacterium]|jgi:DNA-binding transcriptional LysR family regulator|nr:LysR family transcriptional regulator [Actinomycetes bacterium]